MELRKFQITLETRNLEQYWGFLVPTETGKPASLANFALEGNTTSKQLSTG